MRSERITFNGITYYRYPDSERRDHRVYFQRQGKSLHRAIWEAHNGPIPPGHEVHHEDGDPLNNDPSNLVLLGISEHRRLSAAARKDHDLTCTQCGRSYVGKRTRPNHANTFCSKRCKGSWGYHHTLVGRYQKVCPKCGQEFMGQRKQVCCSRACSLQHRPRGFTVRDG